MKLHYILSISLLYTNCGENPTERQKMALSVADRTITSEETNSSELTTDTTLASEGVSTQIDEGISSMLEDMNMSAATNFGLAQETNAAISLDSEKNAESEEITDSKPVLSFSRACQEQEGKAMVDIKREISFTRSIDRPRFSINFSNSHYESISREWSQEGSSISCNRNKKYAVLPFEDANGLSLKVNFERKKELSQTKTNKKTSVSTSKAHFLHAMGERTIVWDSVESSSTQIIINKIVTSSVTREIEVKNKSGQTKKISLSIATDPEKPLKIEVSRAKDDFFANYRLIKSGSLISTLNDGGKTIVAFSDVMYEKKCLPSSGTISGKIFSADDLDNAKISFTIAVTDGEGTIKFYDANGTLSEEKSYDPADCDIEVGPEKMEKESIAASE